MDMGSAFSTLSEFRQKLMPPTKVTQPTEEPDPEVADAMHDSWQLPLGVPYKDNEPQAPPFIQPRHEVHRRPLSPGARPVSPASLSATLEVHRKPLYLSARPVSPASLSATLGAIEDRSGMSVQIEGFLLDMECDDLEMPASAHLASSSIYEPSIAPSSKYSRSPSVISTSTIRGRSSHSLYRRVDSVLKKRSGEHVIDHAREYTQLISPGEYLSFCSEPEPEVVPKDKVPSGGLIDTGEIAHVANNSIPLSEEVFSTKGFSRVENEINNLQAVTYHRSKRLSTQATGAFPLRAADDKGTHSISAPHTRKEEAEKLKARYHLFRRQFHRLYNLRFYAGDTTISIDELTQRLESLSRVQKKIADCLDDCGLDEVAFLCGEENQRILKMSMDSGGTSQVSTVRIAHVRDLEKPVSNSARPRAERRSTTNAALVDGRSSTAYRRLSKDAQKAMKSTVSSSAWSTSKQQSSSRAATSISTSNGASLPLARSQTSLGHNCKIPTSQSKKPRPQVPELGDRVKIDPLAKTAVVPKATKVSQRPLSSMAMVVKGTSTIPRRMSTKPRQYEATQLWKCQASLRTKV